jgi:hypothetical protein
MSQIKVLKLSGGQEVVAKILDSDLQSHDGWVELEDPLMISPMQDEEGNIRIQLLPFALFSKSKTYLFNSTSILTVFDPIDQIEDSYRRQTSGLILANSQDLKQLQQSQGLLKNEN